MASTAYDCRKSSVGLLVLWIRHEHEVIGLLVPIRKGKDSSASHGVLEETFDASFVDDALLHRDRGSWRAMPFQFQESSALTAGRRKGHFLLGWLVC
jgi:hypothetical protein